MDPEQGTQQIQALTTNIAELMHQNEELRRAAEPQNEERNRTTKNQNKEDQHCVGATGGGGVCLD